MNLEALEQLFIHLEGKSERKLRELRYVLCLILLRKRRLKVRQIVRDHEGESFIVHRPRQAESLSVFVFDFTPERIDQLRAELQHIFDGAEPDSLPEAQLAAVAPAEAPALAVDPAYAAAPVVADCEPESPRLAAEPAPR